MLLPYIHPNHENPILCKKNLVLGKVPWKQGVVLVQDISCPEVGGGGGGGTIRPQRVCLTCHISVGMPSFDLMAWDHVCKDTLFALCSPCAHPVCSVLAVSVPSALGKGDPTSTQIKVKRGSHCCKPADLRM